MKKFITLTLCSGNKIALIAKDISSIKEYKEGGLKRVLVKIGADEWIIDSQFHSVEQIVNEIEK